MQEQFELGLNMPKVRRNTLCGVRTKDEQAACQKHCPYGCLSCLDRVDPPTDQRFLQGLRELQARESMILSKETI